LTFLCTDDEASGFVFTRETLHCFSVNQATDWDSEALAGFICDYEHYELIEMPPLTDARYFKLDNNGLIVDIGVGFTIEPNEKALKDAGTTVAVEKVLADLHWRREDVQIDDYGICSQEGIDVRHKWTYEQVWITLMPEETAKSLYTCRQHDDKW
jgi:hypothetical protein